MDSEALWFLTPVELQALSERYLSQQEKTDTQWAVQMAMFYNAHKSPESLPMGVEQFLPGAAAVEEDPEFKRKAFEFLAAAALPIDPEKIPDWAKTVH